MVLSIVFGTLVAYGETRIGFVLDISGEWRLAEQTILKGQSLSGGATVQLVADSDRREDAHLTIILLNGRSYNIVCSTAQRCEKGIRLPPSVIEQRTLTERLIQAGLRVFSRQPERYIPGLSRGNSTLDLHDGVAQVDSQGVGLGSVLRNAQAGLYTVEFQSISEDATTGKKRDLQFRWSTTGPFSIPMVGLSSGLYNLSLFYDNSKGKTAQASCWVYLVESEKYTKASADFREIEKATHYWDENIREQAVRSFLRATLEYLATQP
jgi:hypothetical protein